MHLKSETLQFQKNQFIFPETKRMSQSILNYLNNVIDFPANFRFESYDEKKESSKIIKFAFDKFENVKQIADMFESCENVKPEFKLNTVFPNIKDYKIRGILSLSQQYQFDDSNIQDFLNYHVKVKSQPTLEEYSRNIISYLKDDKIKIKIFNSVFPHGIHAKSIGKDELKGVDKIYLQKIGSCFEQVLDQIVKGKDSPTVNKSIIQTTIDAASRNVESGKKAFKENALKIDIMRILETEKLPDTPENKEKKKELSKELKSFKKEIQDWIQVCCSEIQLASRLREIIRNGLEYNNFGEEELKRRYDTYLNHMKEVRKLAEEKINSNKEYLEFATKIIEFGDSIFGKDKGISLLHEAEASPKSLLGKKDSKTFMEGGDLDDSVVENLFTSRSEFSLSKAIQKLVNYKSLPPNVKIALGIYISNEFVNEVEKLTANKSWSKRTIYVKF